MGETYPGLKLALMGKSLEIPYPIVAQWAVMLLIVVVVLFMRRKMEQVPRGKQVWLEVGVEKINSMVRSNMGESYEGFAPFIGTLFIFLLMLNLFGLTGLRPPTADYSVTLALALISFFLIQATAIRKHGFFGYLKGYAHPFAAMLPLNIIERFIVPISLSLRLFGNITAAVILVELIYKGLAHISESLHLGIPILTAIIPIPFHIYFDIFDGVIQTLIFVMLTMIFIKTTSEH